MWKHANHSWGGARLVAFCFIIQTLLPGATSESSGHSRVFKSQKYGFSVYYPRNWRLSSKGDAFQIFNFPSSRAVRGAVLPRDGAGISVAVPDEMAPLKGGGGGSPIESLEGWVQIESGLYGFQPLGQRRLEVAGGSSSVTGIELIGVSGTGAVAIESVDWFFTAGRRMFLVSLYYRRGNPGAAKLREILKDVALSVIPTA